MSENECPRCYGPSPSFSCGVRRARSAPVARLPLVVGTIGLPLLVIGILGLIPQAAFAGAIIAGCGALAHVIAVLRSK